MVDWTKLANEHDPELIQLVRNRLDSGKSPQVDIDQFVNATHELAAVEVLFDELVQSGTLTVKDQLFCADCKRPIKEAEIVNGRCPECDFDFDESGEHPIRERIYQSTGALSREIPWLILIHGFNTYGEWQEEFNWLLGTRFKHRVPVLIHKFSYLRLGVLNRRKHQKLVAQLDQHIRSAIAHARNRGIKDPPDIIAHSFGSLLFAKLLARPDSQDLNFGRVVLAGAVVRPDFDWTAYKANGRVETVLNHCGAKDQVVGWAQYTIPDSGPSGNIGCVDQAVFNLRGPEIDHGTNFEPEIVIQNLAFDGPWDKFLRLPTASFSAQLEEFPRPVDWKSAPAWIRRIIVTVVYVAIATAAVTLVGLVFWPWWVIVVGPTPF